MCYLKNVIHKLFLPTVIVSSFIWLLTPRLFCQGTVQVIFQIEESGAREAYQMQMDELKALAAETIREELAKAFPFIDFSSDSSENVLFCSIIPSTPNESMYAIDMGMQLSVRGVKKGDHVRYLFRPLEAFFEPFPGSVEAFNADLRLALQEWLENERETFINEILGWVNITNNAHPEFDEDIWVIHLGPQLCYIGRLSEIQVVSGKDELLPFKTIYTKAVGEEMHAHISENSDFTLDQINANWQTEGCYIKKLMPPERLCVAEPIIHQ